MQYGIGISLSDSGDLDSRGSVSNERGGGPVDISAKLNGIK